MAKTFVDFRLLKERVSFWEILTFYRLRLRRVGEHSWRGVCPLPSHTSRRSTNSFSVDEAKGLWTCYSASCVAARGGRIGGDILDFVALMENCSIREAALRLERRTAGDFTAGRRIATSGEPCGSAHVSKGMKANRPLPFVLKNLDPTHPYLVNRGITVETAREFGVGFYAGKGLLGGRIVFPIRDEEGRLVAYVGRSIDGSNPKYLFPKGFRKSAVLFNLHRVSSKEIVLVEGFFDCLKVSQAGIRSVVALLGSSLSIRQQELLARFERVTLFLDGDDAGRSATRIIANRLVRSHYIRIPQIGLGRQPDQLSSEEIRDLLRR